MQQDKGNKTKATTNNKYDHMIASRDVGTHTA